MVLGLVLRSTVCTKSSQFRDRFLEIEVLALGLSVSLIFDDKHNTPNGQIRCSYRLSVPVVPTMTPKHFLDGVGPRSDGRQFRPCLYQRFHDGGIVTRSVMPAVLGAVRRPADRRGVEVILGVVKQGIRSEQSLEPSARLPCQAAQCRGVPPWAREAAESPAWSIRRTALMSLSCAAWPSQRGRPRRASPQSRDARPRAQTEAASCSQQATMNFASRGLRSMSKLSTSPLPLFAAAW